MTYQEQEKELTDKIVSSLLRIKRHPEGWLPHAVFVEEEGTNGHCEGVPVYTQYQLLGYLPDGNCLLGNSETGQLEHDDYHLNDINVDWLVTVWNRYTELSAEQELWKDHAIEVLLQHTEADEMEIRTFVGEQWQNLLPDEENIAAFRLQAAPDKNPLEYPLRRLLDVAQLEIPCFEQSQTYDICATVLDGLKHTLAASEKELWAFVWDCSHMDRYATDEEILAAWENGPSRSSDKEDEREYEVEKLTPDELTERMNDDEYAYTTDFVRFIYTDK